MGQRERARQDGISLVEVLVAMSVLAIVMTGFAHLVIGSVRNLSLSEARQQAYTAATRALESARSLAFEEIGHPRTDESGSPFSFDTFDPVAGTMAAPGTGETVWRLTGGAVGDAAPFRMQTDGLDLSTVVTHPDVDDPTQVRVTAVVEFDRGGQTEVLRQSTLVNRNVEWGLAQPRFSVSPVTAGIPIERGSERCVDHTVQNLGADDQYRLLVPDPTTDPVLASDYDLRFVEVRAGGVEVPLIPGALTAEYTTGATFGIRACYDAEATASTVEEVTLVLQSRIAEETSIDAAELASRSQQLVHGLDVVTERLLHLGSRNEEARDPGTPYVLVEDAPTLDTLVNFDTNVDARPGLLLPRAVESSATWEGRWRYALGPDRALTGAQLHFWYASPASLEGFPLPPEEEPTAPPDPEAPPAEEPPPEPPPTLTLVIELRRLDAAGSTLAVLHRTIATLPLDASTWMERTLELGVAAPVRFDAGDDLELAIACDPASASDCLLAFGATPFPTSLRVVFP